MTLYALKIKGSNKLLGFETTKNEDTSNCIDITYELCNFSEKIWVTPSKEIAEKVSKMTEKYYNADYDSPVNKYIGQLEVVELSAKI